MSPNQAKLVLIELLLSLTLYDSIIINSCKTEHFIYKGGCGICVSWYLKEVLAWAIDKQFQFTISYYTIPLETCKEIIGWLQITFSYPKIFVIRTLENEKVLSIVLITKGLLY